MQASSEPEGLPAPTGRYQVGRVSFDLVDPHRTEIYSSNPEDRREWSRGSGNRPRPAPTPSGRPTCRSRGHRPASFSDWTPPACSATRWRTRRWPTMSRAIRGCCCRPGGRGRAFRRWERRAGVVSQRPALPGRGQPGRSPVDGGWACRLERPVLQILAEHPEFALSGTDAVTAGMATDAAAYDAEKAITFDGWRTVHQRGPRATRCRSRGQPT
jgi:hypothetical protein